MVKLFKIKANIILREANKNMFKLSRITFYFKCFNTTVIRKLYEFEDILKNDFFVYKVFNREFSLIVGAVFTETLIITKVDNYSLLVEEMAA